MKKGLFVLIGLLVVVMLAACNDNAGEDETILDELEGQDIKETVHNYSDGSFDDVSASITSHELIVTDQNDKETAYELPEEEFFVSIAPYVDTTHPCEIHSLTGCQGELVEEEFDLFIEDEDGNVVMDEKVNSLENGFIDLWLPRDQTYQVTIEHDGKVTESEISTFEGDNTCVTTMQLT
ncbi:CueP family metal-binding protein [Alkalibacillus aidingensis]|uniref:CueP family metal-binding protein n=1 Tax=Alkalibacillus aidingensis TaxID=2747607 RepID=UPI0016606849|nr:CueP family metal-binding protein [Alkalibacillus aidingensis]